MLLSLVLEGADQLSSNWSLHTTESYTSHGSNLKNEDVWQRGRDLLKTLMPPKSFSESHDTVLTSKLFLNFLPGICMLAAQAVISLYASEINCVSIFCNWSLTHVVPFLNCWGFFSIFFLDSFDYILNFFSVSCCLMEETLMLLHLYIIN